MAPRSARSPKGGRPNHGLDETGGVGMFLARHRKVVGALTAFAVAFSYVAANAIWYQPHAHGNALFATRPLPAPEGGAAATTDDGAMAEGSVETVIKLEREPAEAPPGKPDTQIALLPVPDIAPTPIAAPAKPAVPSGDPVVQNVQSILADLNLYSGEIDGLTGPQTRNAIESYRRIVGLSVSTDIDDQLLNQLGASPRSASASPPLPSGSPGTDMIETSSAVPKSDPMIMRIQAGLKAFGNDGIEIDGVAGSRTKSAILEFQSLFGLPETGQPDEALYAKMREIGLTN